MQSFRIVLIGIALLLLIGGCSKEKKDAAAKLEQELLNDTQPEVDSTIADTLETIAEVVDSTVDFEVSAVPEEEPPKMMPKQPAGEGFTVQVAGCEDSKYAEFLVERYTKRGYDPYVTTITVEGQTFYRVRIGIFESFRSAKSLQAELTDKYSEPSWIDVTVNNY